MKKEKATITAEELDRRFDAGEDISQFLDWDNARRPGLKPRRVNVDLPGWMITELDNQASRIGVTRQSIIKVWLSERIKTEKAELEPTKGYPSDLVMLLPHGYEGMGPEHSSARLERFLQLCAEKNLIVGNFTTPAQYFHALRRQKHRDFRKPLVLMTPKSLLSRAEAVSQESDFLEGTCFQEILPDTKSFANPADVSRIIFCCGKVYYDLMAHRQEKGIENAAIIRIEQLYPFHREMVEAIISQYSSASHFVWCQEEPLNMGAWSYIFPRLERAVGSKIRYAGRGTASSPAAGSKAMHYREQKALVAQAFEV